MEIATLITILSGFQPRGTEHPVIIEGLDFKTRLKNLLNAFVTDGLTESVHSLHPNAMKFLEVWESYIQISPESTGHYELMKKSFINAFGEKWFNEYLFYSYYFVRTPTMIERGYTDNNLRPIGY